jgi:hypothetical protein
MRNNEKGFQWNADLDALMDSLLDLRDKPFTSIDVIVGYKKQLEDIEELMRQDVIYQMNKETGLFNEIPKKVEAIKNLIESSRMAVVMVMN